MLQRHMEDFADTVAAAEALRQHVAKPVRGRLGRIQDPGIHEALCHRHVVRQLPKLAAVQQIGARESPM